MHTLAASFVLGFHGCDAETAERVLAGERFVPSTNDYDWLGRGTYFWEANPKRGLEYARDMAIARKGAARVRNPAVVGAIIDLGRCLDLTTSAGVDQVRKAYEVLRDVAAKSSTGILPENTRDGLRRKLDCAVINVLHQVNDDEGRLPIDTVRGIFIEGAPIYETSGFHEKTHVQICVCDPDRIKGVFRVRDSWLV